MKRFILLFAALMLSIMLSAQTQQGYVKTKGRMVNGQIVHGQGLKGATVSIKGRTAVLVNADDGAFSFPVPEAQFRIDSVRKKGYQLVDVDALTKTYKQSTNPIYLVMETPEQQLQDQLAAERRIRRTLTNQLHQKEDEIEALKEQRRISDEEYRQALQKLYEETDQNEQLVKDMVERYSIIDYDQLGEFDQRISELILNGELVKADSMLRTKGDIIERVKQYRKHEAINAKEKEELTRRQASLEQSVNAIQKECNELANDCYQMFQICKMRHENDSAAYYFQTHCDLDSMNTTHLRELGTFYLKYLMDFERALKCYRKALSISENQPGNATISDCYNSIANYYVETKELDSALFYYEKCKDNCIKKYGKQHESYAINLLSIANVYRWKGDNETSLEMINNTILPFMNNDKAISSDKDRASVYGSIGNVFYSVGDYETALQYYNMAALVLDSCDGLYPLESITTYTNTGSVLAQLGKYELAMEQHNKAMELCHIVLGDLHPQMAVIATNIGSIYANKFQHIEAIKFLEKALEIDVMTYGKNSPNLILDYNNLGQIQTMLDDYDNAIMNYEKAFSICDKNLPKSHPIYAVLYNNLGSVYAKQKEYDKAIELYKKALELRIAIYGENSNSVSTVYNNLGYIYHVKKDYSAAEENYQKALAIGLSALGEDHPGNAITYYNLGDVCESQSKYEEALSFYGKALEIRQQAFGSDHEEVIKLKNIISEIQAKLKEQENEPQNEE